MFNVVVTALGALVLVLGLVSKRLKHSPIPPTLAALLVGVALGPAALGWIDLSAMGNQELILEKAARLTLGIGLISVALRIPTDYTRRHWREMLVLVGAGMVLMWAVSAALVWSVLGLPLGLAALIGAVVTPTDPIAATPIVTGDLAKRHLPDRLRNAISFESGVNDGLAYLFVFLPFLLIMHPPGEAWTRWLFETLLWQVGAATAAGLTLGWAAGRTLQAAEKGDLIGENWRLVYTAALALVAIGAGRLIHSDEVLMVFAAGLMFRRCVDADDRQEEEHGQEAVNRFFSIPIFALVGLAIPWHGWADLGWRGVLLAALILLLRRPPVLLLLARWLPSIQSRRETLFVGWFGPVAVAAVYYATLMTHRLGEPVVWHVVSLVICASVVAHGVTSAALTRRMSGGEQLSGSA
jgi:NhaP-type Na+/H+ or K+/H+ antiporter